MTKQRIFFNCMNKDKISITNKRKQRHQKQHETLACDKQCDSNSLYISFTPIQNQQMKEKNSRNYQHVIFATEYIPMLETK